MIRFGPAILFACLPLYAQPQFYGGEQTIGGSLNWAAAPTATYNASGTTTFDWSRSNVFKVTAATGNSTPAFTNGSTGTGLYYIITVQDATVRSWTSTPSTIKGITMGNIVSASFIQEFLFDGTNYIGKAAQCFSGCTGLFISGPEMSAITATDTGTQTCTFDSASHTMVCFGHNLANRHAMPRLASGDQLTCSDLLGGCIGGSGTVTSVTVAGTSGQITVTGTCTITTTGTCTLSIPSPFTTPGSIVSGNDVITGGLIYRLGSTVINLSTDGKLVLTNNAQSGFTLLTGGPATLSFPAWKRNGAAWESRLGDDSTTAVTITKLPTSCSGLATGVLWNNSGAPAICP